tara:strand:+ start:25 stop:648 length:624 start_codon:yes stop_codon:yes gene_type:complete
MTSRLVVNSVRHTGASADGITLDASGNVTFPANATCSGTATGFGGGKILKVVSTTKTDYFTANDVSSYTDVTGMTLNITPTSTGSKILILINLQYGDNGNGYTGFRLLRGSTSIGFTTALDNQNSSNTRDSAFGAMSGDAQNTYKLHSSSYSFLDNPSYNLGDTLTYKLQLITWSSTTFHLNRPNSIGNARYTMGGASTISAMEIAA